MVRDSAESPLTKVYIDTIISETTQRTTMVNFVLWKAVDAQTEIAQSAVPIAFLDIMQSEKDPCIRIVTLSDDIKLPIMPESKQVIPQADTDFTRRIGAPEPSGEALARMSVEQAWHRDNTALDFKLRNRNGKTQLSIIIVVRNRTLMLEVYGENGTRQLLNLQNVDEIV